MVNALHSAQVAFCIQGVHNLDVAHILKAQLDTPETSELRAFITSHAPNGRVDFYSTAQKSKQARAGQDGPAIGSQLI